MKQQVVVIHGGDAFENYEDYLASLRSIELTLERLRSIGWKGNLASDLGDDFDVLTPRMPNGQNARYLEWKIWFEKIIPLLADDIILIGHSLGGIFIAKYLSEENFPKIIKATFLVAAPYNTPTRHPLVDFNITTPLNKFAKQAGEIYLFHSKDDVIVPFNNVKHYHQELLDSKLIVFEDRGHFNSESFPELLEEVKRISNPKLRDN